jgi:hypothetical protein
LTDRPLSSPPRGAPIAFACGTLHAPITAARNMFTQSKPAGEAIGGLAKIRWRQTRPRVPDEEVNLIFSCGLGLREPFCHNKEKRNSIHFAFCFHLRKKTKERK